MDCGKLANCGDKGVHECCCEYIDDPKRCVRFDVDETSTCPRAPPGSGGVCACCQQAEQDAKPTPPSGRPVIVYEVPEPMFDDLTTNKRDYTKKPLPKKEMPPWHPIHKLRWQALEVPSMSRTTYQTDFTPPKVSRNVCPPPAQIPQFLPPRQEKQDPPQQEQRLCKRMTRGPDHVHGVCEKTQTRQGVTTQVLEDRQQPCKQCNCCTLGNPPTGGPPQNHDPTCELYCYSSDTRCHTADPPRPPPVLRPREKKWDPPRPLRTIPGKFTLCEKKSEDDGPERWWKRGCDPNSKNKPKDCDCSGNPNPSRSVKFERGGLIP